MVHLFTMMRSGRAMSVLARNINGEFKIESINGHHASAYPAFIAKMALRHFPKEMPVTNRPVVELNDDDRVSPSAFNLDNLDSLFS